MCILCDKSQNNDLVRSNAELGLPKLTSTLSSMSQVLFGQKLCLEAKQ